MKSIVDFATDAEKLNVLKYKLFLIPSNQRNRRYGKLIKFSNSIISLLPNKN